VPASYEVQRRVKSDPFANIAPLEDQLDAMLNAMADDEEVVSVGFGTLGPALSNDSYFPMQYIITSRGVHFVSSQVHEEKAGMFKTNRTFEQKAQFVPREAIGNADGMVLPWEADEAMGECYSRDGDIVFQVRFMGGGSMPAAAQLNRFMESLQALGVWLGGNTEPTPPPEPPIAAPAATSDTWGELRDWVVSSFTAPDAPGRVEDASDPDQIVLLLEIPNGRLQKVLVRRFVVADDDEWVEVATVVCEEHEIEARDALIQNSSFALGHFALDPDRHLVWYRHTLQLRFLTPRSDQFVATLVLMMKVGDHMEYQLTGDDKW